MSRILRSTGTNHTLLVGGIRGGCLLGGGFPVGAMNTFGNWTVDVLSATELFALKPLILCYVNFATIKSSKIKSKWGVPCRNEGTRPGYRAGSGPRSAACTFPALQHPHVCIWPWGGTGSLALPFFCLSASSPRPPLSAGPQHWGSAPTCGLRSAISSVLGNRQALDLPANI